MPIELDPEALTESAERSSRDDDDFYETAVMKQKEDSVRRVLCQALQEAANIAKRLDERQHFAGLIEGWRDLVASAGRCLRDDAHFHAKSRGAHAFEARADGSLIIYATLPNGDGEPIHIEPHRVAAVLAACGDALARKFSRR